MFGSEWQLESGRSDGIVDLGFPLEADFTLDRDTLSFFVEGQLRRERWLFQASARRDDPSDVDARTSVQTGVIVDLNGEESRLRLNWGKRLKRLAFSLWLTSGRQPGFVPGNRGKLRGRVVAGYSGRGW